MKQAPTLMGAAVAVAVGLVAANADAGTYPEIPNLIAECATQNFERDNERMIELTARGLPSPIVRSWGEDATLCGDLIIRQCSSDEARRNFSDPEHAPGSGMWKVESTKRCLRHNEELSVKRAEDRRRSYQVRVNECVLRSHVPGDDPSWTWRACMAATPR
jgi:hypothetical protein